MRAARIPIDWPMCITRIRNRKRWSTRALGSAIGTSHTTISMIERDMMKEPGFTVGLRLLDLHLEVCPAEHASLIKAAA